ncbi:MAG: STAS domain-containing protein [Calditrichota bacterium]|jgi:anti-sigma B factor antagonist
MDIQYDFKKQDEVLIFTILDKDITHQNAASLKEKLFVEIAQGHNRIILDLKDVNELDSSGLGALLFGKRQADNAGGNILLVAVKPSVQSMIRIAQLSRVFASYETVEEAMKELQK